MSAAPTTSASPMMPNAALIGSSAGLCHIRMFKPQFAPLVLSGEKCQTVRPTPKRMPKAGDRISLRMWTGKPYRSKQRVLRESVLTEILPVKINAAAIMVNGCVLLGDEEWEFARADGFNTPQDLLEWFNFTHGLPFEGVVMKWHNSEVSGAGATAATENTKSATRQRSLD